MSWNNNNESEDVFAGRCGGQQAITQSTDQFNTVSEDDISGFVNEGGVRMWMVGSSEQTLGKMSPPNTIGVNHELIRTFRHCVARLVNPGTVSLRHQRNIMVDGLEHTVEAKPEENFKETEVKIGSVVWLLSGFCFKFGAIPEPIMGSSSQFTQGENLGMAFGAERQQQHQHHQRQQFVPYQSGFGGIGPYHQQQQQQQQSGFGGIGPYHRQQQQQQSGFAGFGPYHQQQQQQQSGFGEILPYQQHTGFGMNGMVMQMQSQMHQQMQMMNLMFNRCMDLSGAEGNHQESRSRRRSGDGSDGMSYGGYGGRNGTSGPVSRSSRRLNQRAQTTPYGSGSGYNSRTMTLRPRAGRRGGADESVDRNDEEGGMEMDDGEDYEESNEEEEKEEENRGGGASKAKGKKLKLPAMVAEDRRLYSERGDTTRAVLKFIDIFDPLVTMPAGQLYKEAAMLIWMDDSDVVRCLDRASRSFWISNLLDQKIPCQYRYSLDGIKCQFGGAWSVEKLNRHYMLEHIAQYRRQKGPVDPIKLVRTAGDGRMSMTVARQCGYCPMLINRCNWTHMKEHRDGQRNNFKDVCAWRNPCEIEFTADDVAMRNDWRYRSWQRASVVMRKVIGPNGLDDLQKFMRHHGKAVEMDWSRWQYDDDFVRGGKSEDEVGHVHYKHFMYIIVVGRKMYVGETEKDIIARLVSHTCKLIYESGVLVCTVGHYTCNANDDEEMSRTKRLCLNFERIIAEFFHRNGFTVVNEFPKEFRTWLKSITQHHH